MPEAPQQWIAPLAPVPVNATVTVPGSKSETNRALVLAALSSGPSAITGGLEARDTALMRDALRTLGVTIEENGDVWVVTPPEQFTAGGTIDCGLAGTVMRFVPPLAALAGGEVGFDGDRQAYDRPMEPLLGALAALGATVEGDRMALPFMISGDPALRGGSVMLDASASSQFVSGLLLIGARLADGLDLRHQGPSIPSTGHIGMTVSMLRQRGVRVDDTQPNRWIVAPGEIKPRDVVIEPDVANAAPFLGAALLTGGRIAIPRWPSTTGQPAPQLRAVLEKFGGKVSFQGDSLVVRGRNELHGIDIWLNDASELTPVVAALAALALQSSHIHGVAHIRGHETDRLAALESNLDALGARVRQTHDGLIIHPHVLAGISWPTYADHRMVHAGALLGLVVDEITLDDVSCVGKTMPDFVERWQKMIDDSVAAEQVAGRLDASP
ncbi:3-phosphoshikimate 1-carboxyvinyltransferase [Microlunatus ginsengisoli]|uniref:3-phosphoshikimate 1-carboxyvinyltransferase n=1 Tax=Microlunatus ginsengisoli TaxID=363863 RepID=A0ABP6ZWS1_9ACTN